MKQVYNPYLPLGTFIPDGEPHVFGDRVYIFGSHDQENGEGFCLLDYEGFSAPVDDLTAWRSEGIIYRKQDDPTYGDKYQAMYAPDVVQGNDGRYYLYYAMSGGCFTGPIHVAVCDTPAGKYEYYGEVRNPDGTTFTKNITFDPGVINDNGQIRLYYGWSLAIDPTQMMDQEEAQEQAKKAGFDIPSEGGENADPAEAMREQMIQVQMMMFEKTREEVEVPGGVMGANQVELEDDMLTVKGEVKRIAPGQFDAAGSSFEGHAFFEASSIRKIGDMYYFIYSSESQHELCYATSKDPDGNFVYGGVLVSNGDIGIAGRTPQQRVAATGNDHGSIECINGQWYIFYHRQTSKTSFSRQGCAEPIIIADNGSIEQVEMTSCGLNGGPLVTEGTYPATICCTLSNGHMSHEGQKKSKEDYPYIAAADGDYFVCDITEPTAIGYKYFDFTGQTTLTLTARCQGEGKFLVYCIDREQAAQMPEELPKETPVTEIVMAEPVVSGETASLHTSGWKQYSGQFATKGEYALYLRYVGNGRVDLKEIAF